MTAPFRVLALADSGFPTGGFAHSYGLEAHTSFGAVVGSEDLRRFAEDSLVQAASSMGPVVREAHRGHDLPELDRFVEVRLSSPVQNRASRTQGRTFFATARGVFPSELEALGAVVDELRYVHHAPVFGHTMSKLGVSLDDTVTLFLFAQARGVLSAAVRLGIVGPHEAQSMLDALSEPLRRACAEALQRDLTETATRSPLLELRAGLHDALYARLFLS